MTEVVTKKLTKKQREFFLEYTKGLIQNALVQGSHPEYAEPVLIASSVVLEDMDISPLADLLGKEFLSVLEFKQLDKVDKFLRSEEYIHTVSTANEVIAAQAASIGAVVVEAAKAVDGILFKAEGTVTQE